MKLKALICHYSRTGNNRELALELQRRMACDCEPILPAPPRSFFGCLLSMAFRWPRMTSPVVHDLHSYDIVILCFPVWAGKLPPAVGSFLRRNRDSIKNVAYASLSNEGDPDGTMLLEFISIAGQRPRTQLDINNMMLTDDPSETPKARGIDQEALARDPISTAIDAFIAKLLPS